MTTHPFCVEIAELIAVDNPEPPDLIPPCVGMPPENCKEPTCDRCYHDLRAALSALSAGGK